MGGAKVVLEGVEGCSSDHPSVTASSNHILPHLGRNVGIRPVRWIQVVLAQKEAEGSWVRGHRAERQREVYGFHLKYDETKADKFQVVTNQFIITCV